MDPTEKFEWFAPEYENKEHSQDWFWALGIIVITGALASIIYADYFFATLIVLAGGLLWFFAVREPEMVRYEINNKGIKILNRLYPYENIKAFYVQVGTDKVPATLFLKSERWFMPIIAIPIDNEFAEDLRQVMLAQGVPEEEIKEHPYQRIIESLGF